MAIWHIECDPKVEFNLTGCDVISCREWLGSYVLLIDCDDQAAITVRSNGGIRLMQRPKEGDVFVDGMGESVVITDGGRSWHALEEK